MVEPLFFGWLEFYLINIGFIIILQKCFQIISLSRDLFFIMKKLAFVQANMYVE